MNLLVLAERAATIADPAVKKKVMGQILDLALTKDGRKSFKKTGGKFAHGFIPLDEKAKIAKAKGSPIAMKRMNRLYGGRTLRRGARAATERSAIDGKVTVAGKGGGTRTAATASRLRGVAPPDIHTTQRVKNAQFEKNKVGRVPARAVREWDKIPPEAKTVRNGKRYVVSNFGGKQVLTEWQGGIHDIDAKNTTKFRTLNPADAERMTTAQLRRILKDPKMSKQARQIAYKALQAKIASGKAPTRD